MDEKEKEVRRKLSAVRDCIAQACVELGFQESSSNLDLEHYAAYFSATSVEAAKANVGVLY